MKKRPLATIKVILRSLVFVGRLLHEEKLTEDSCPYIYEIANAENKVIEAIHWLRDAIQSAEKGAKSVKINEIPKS